MTSTSVAIWSAEARPITGRPSVHRAGRDGVQRACQSPAGPRRPQSIAKVEPQAQGLEVM